MAIFFRPEIGAAADFIPFYWQGHYHLFYLQDYRNEEQFGPGTPWWHLVSRDFVSFENWGEALPRGPLDAQDRWVFTGSVIERAGIFHIFYTGHNFNYAGTGKPMEAVMHATSPDLRNWAKDQSFTFFAPDGYMPDDWRDPFVFWNEEAGEYWMLLAARKTAGPNRNRGCVALAVSPDLQQWKVREPFWAPDEYFTHECPDLFRIGDWWYLIYSTFTERCVTHYRMSRSLQGPWRAPENDTFDGRAYYAAKTAGGDGRRFIFGWLPTKNEEQDANGWQWGGDLVVHEVLQRPDGTLKVVLPKSVRAEFSTNQPVSPVPMFGNWHFAGETIESASIGRLSMLTLGELPQECLLETTMAFQHGTYNFGLLLRVSDDAEKYYQVRFEPGNQRVVVDRWPRPGDQAFMLERPVRLMPEQPINVSALISGSCLVVYVNDEIALSCRMYDHSTGNLGLFVTEGNVEFAKIAIQTR